MIGYDEIPERGPVEVLFAAVAEGPAGEAVAGVKTAEGWQPFIVSDKAARLGDLDTMLGQCQQIADLTGRPVRVVKFARAGLVGEFRPGGPT